MRIIDRYLLRQFLQVLTICFLSLTGLYVVIDLFGHLDQFIAHSETHGGLFAVLSEYYGYRALAVFDRISGVLALIAAMFTVTWLQRHNESVALMAAGVTKLRVMAPIILAAVAVSLLAAANRELVIPKIRHQLARDSKDLSGQAASEVRSRWDNETDILIGGDKLFAKDQKISQPKFDLPQTLDSYGRELTADLAFYQPPEGSRPGGYRLVNVRQPQGIGESPSLTLDSRPVILTPKDFKWLGPNECFVASNVNFEMLSMGAGWRNFASTAELIEGLRSPSLDFGADVRVAIHMRFVQPLLDATLLLLGLPLVVSRGNRNIFMAIGLCVALVAVFMLVTLACQNLGASSLIRPALAAWLPLIIFMPLAIGMSDPLRD